MKSGVPSTLNSVRRTAHAERTALGSLETCLKMTFLLLLTS